MMFEADKVTTFVAELLKQWHPGHHLVPIILLRFPDQEICIVSHLEQYIEKTKDLWKGQNLLISFVKPHKRITTSIIFSWYITVLNNAGVDVTVFGSHLARSVSTAHCKRKGLLLEGHLLRRLWSITINQLLMKMEDFQGFY